MKYGVCEDCRTLQLLTKHSKIGGHKEGDGYHYCCRKCHNKIHKVFDGRTEKRFQRGSGGKTAKGTRRIR